MSSSTDEKYEFYENALLGILQDHGQIVPFLDTVFKFLYRRTDFFRIQHDPSEKMGFPPRMAEKLVLAALKKYEKLAREDDEAREPPEKQSAQKAPEETKTTEAETKTTSSDKAESAEPVAEPAETVAEHAETFAEPAETVAEQPSDGKQDVADDSRSADGPADGASEQEEETDEEAKRLKQQQRLFQSQSQSYNGAIRDNYSWSQSIMDVDAYIYVPAKVTRGNQVVVDMKHSSISVKMKDGDELKELVSGELCWKVNVENSCWTLIPGESVHLNLEKVQERWWDSLLAGEPKINIRNIDASRPMSDLGEEEQAKIEELMFNEHQKRLGKPTIEQLKMEKILKDAWDMEGSPFKGQPFDMSTINIASSGDTSFAQQ